ncbi:MAG: protein-L-isoaspartate O-methyltransferase [Spirochaetes bacterium]|nr:protein-L-isoaspartate O-methyltransferase [Spirochaetota bacterium]
MRDNSVLIQHIRLRSSLYLDNIERDEKVLDAMLKVDRKNFLPSNVKKIAYEDVPLLIGYGQTCSQPSMVAFMLDKLKIEKGNKILEIGAGCGYAAAIASILTGPEGMVYASEIVPDLCDSMRINLAEFIDNITILSEDGSAGFTEHAPFDRILISAGVASKNFETDILLDQLNDKGILLYPETYGNIYVIKKNGKNLKKETYYGVSFVPLKGKNS